VCLNKTIDQQLLFSSYSVLPEWYVHEEPIDNESMEAAIETNENTLTNGQEAKKKPMLGQDSMTFWER
jgi:hypothetical protein